MVHKQVINISFIGAGNIATQHMNYLKKFPDVKIFGVYDIHQNTVLAKQHGCDVGFYNSLDQMLDGVKPDAVFICIPPYAHGKAEMMCIERKIPFLVEKPLAREIDVARRIASEVKNSGVITSVAYMNRYREGVQKAKKLIEKFPVTMIHGGWIINPPNMDHPWLMKHELSGGQVVEQTTHLFDIVRYLCGEVSYVQCYGTKGFIPISDTYNTYDATGTLFRFKSGIFASILSSWSSGLENKIYLNLSGVDINIQFNGWDFDAQISSRDHPEAVYIPGEKNIFAIEDRAFVNAVKHNNPAEVLSDYANGVKSLEISIAANKSLEAGSPVSLAEGFGENAISI